MKKLTFYAIVTLLFLSFAPTEVKAKAESTPISITATGTSAVQANMYLARLDEINNLDKSSLSPRQKKTLRNEVKAIRERLQTLDGGIYISVGAIIIILLLLIILF